MKTFVNLISDTVTKPDNEMIDYMLNAEVGDDVFKEDPTVNKLELMLCGLFGKESALYFPSGTMANQTAIKIHTQPGDQLICDHFSHIFNYEGGGVSFNSGVSCSLIEGDRGRIKAEQVEEKINPSDFYHSPRTSLVSIENTTNKGGGACYDIRELKKINKVCNKYGFPIHLDGARLWNAMVATDSKPTDYGKLFDTISVCFSKGLGAPVGSALICSKKNYEKALRIRKILGGGMRQSGYLAAAAIYGIENNWEKLKEDHRKAKELSKILIKVRGVKNIYPVETNIIIFEFENENLKNHFIKDMNNSKIKIISMDKQKLRMVTHRDYNEEQHEYVLESLKKLW